MQQSGRRSPCPACQRTKDSDCRWSDEVILCHSGSDLRPGDVITLEGSDWYLSRHNGGYDGQAAVFRPHKPRTNEPLVVRRTRAAVQLIDDITTIEAEAKAFDALATKALGIPPVEQMLDDDIRAAKQACQEAFTAAKRLLVRATRAKRHDPTLEPVWEAITATQRELKYQLADLEEYCANPGLYWQRHLLHTSAGQF